MQVMLGATCDRPWATCLESQSSPQLVAASVGPGSMWEGKFTPRLAFTSTKPQEQVSRRSKTPQHLLLPAGCLLGSVTERASGGMWVA